METPEQRKRRYGVDGLIESITSFKFDYFSSKNIRLEKLGGKVINK